MRDLAEQAVFRICSEDDPESVFGTAFVVEPGLALTCAHVLAGTEKQKLALTGKSGTFPVSGAALLPADPAQIDLALLPIDRAAPVLLACAASEHLPERLRARGYSPAAIGAGGRELRFETRSQGEARYKDYRIEAAIDLVGDVAEKGFSGSPLIDPDSGAAIAVLSGGDRGRERYWAVSLRMAAQAWPELAQALSWNEANLPRYGTLVNALGALQACAAQVEHEVARMRTIKRYDPALSVARAQVHAALPAFREQPHALALAIVGESNTGKTWLLCDAARSSTLSPMLLLAAADLPRPDPPPLSKWIAGSLEAAWAGQSRREQVPPPDRLAQALSGRSNPLLIALDGVNEVLDIRHFLSRWLPEALDWSRKFGARLMFTTRPEPWPAIARAVPHAEMLYYRNAMESEAYAPAERRRVWLGDFTSEEAEAAVGRYHLALNVAEALGRHPLMYRVAADLGLNVSEARVGRYRLLDEFADRQIDDATNVLGARPGPAIRRRVRALAADLSTDGAMAFDKAVRILGNEETLDALTEAGLLSRNAAGVRFTYDQVGEAMLPAPTDMGTLFAPETLTDARMFRRSVVGLLRLEADGHEAGLTSGLEILRSALADAEAEASADWWEILEGLTYLTQSLPSTRMAVVDAVVDLTTDHRDEILRGGGVSQLVAFLEAAPTALERKCALLLSLVPWDDAWPFRYKDWSDADRRPSFAQALERTARRASFEPPREQSGYMPNVAGALDRLHAAHRDLVRPMLISALDDETRIDKGSSSDSRGEATVASLAAGLLFHRSSEDLEGLLDELFVKWTSADGILLMSIAAEFPERVMSHALMRASGQHPNTVMLEALGVAMRTLSPELRACAVPTLEAMLAESGELGSTAASVLREADPGHVAAWDRYADDVLRGRSGFKLHPVPEARFGRALEIAAAKPEAGLDWMSLNDGPEEQQIAMAHLASRLLARNAVRPFLFGRLAEDKLRERCRIGGDRFRPWLEFAHAVSDCDDAEARLCLVYAVFHDHSRLLLPDIAALADRLHQRITADGVGRLVKTLMGVLLDGHVPLWSEHFARARPHDPCAADEYAYRALSQSNHQQSGAEVLVAFWRALPKADLSPLSANVLARLDAGETLRDVFALAWWQLKR